MDQLRKWARVQRGLADEQLAKGQVAEGTNSRIESKKTSDDAVRKRAEREEKRRQKAALAAAATEGESLLSAPPEPTPTPSTAPPAESVITITIPTTATTHEWYNPPASTIFDTIESAQDEGFWLFPRSEMEQSRCAIFRDLWEKGHFMGGGTKFGAEYLVYPGMCCTLSASLALTQPCNFRRRPSALSFASSGICARVSYSSNVGDGDRGTRQARNRNEKSSSPMCMGQESWQGTVHVYRVGRVRLVDILCI